MKTELKLWFSIAFVLGRDHTGLVRTWYDWNFKEHLTYKSPKPPLLNLIDVEIRMFSAALGRGRGAADRGWEPLTYPLSIDFAPLIAADGNAKSPVI